MKSNGGETPVPALTYVVATRNKLPFVRVMLPRLLEAMGDDEEAIVVDGASDDGTSSYLASVAAADSRVTVISEPDHGEAHALNKGHLLARGALIKLISDDDVFSFAAIRECREYMEAHPDVDVVAGNLAGCSLEDPTDQHIMWEFEEEFRAWRLGQRRRFCFCGLPLMLRRDALPLLGLFRTDVVVVDLEFSLRITSVANLAWYTGVLACRIENAASNLRTMNARAAEESNRLWEYYSSRPVGELEARPLSARRVVTSLRSTVRLRTRLRTTRAWHLLVPDRRQLEQATLDLGGAPEEAAAACDSMLATWQRELPAGFIRHTRDGAPNRPRVAVIPDPFRLVGSLCSGGTELRLISDALECAGYDVVSAPRQGDRSALGWLSESCPDIVYIARLPAGKVSDSASRRGYWFPRLTETRLLPAVDRWLAGLESTRASVIWQVDGILSPGTDEASREQLDANACRRLFEIANGLAFHEESCARAVFELFGQTKEYCVAPLGDSAVLYGPPLEKRECRLRLRLPQEQKILLTVSSGARDESLPRLMGAVSATGSDRALVVVAGVTMAGYTRPRGGVPVREYGSVSNRMMRDLMCAADFVVESERCLTSGILRTAMSYSTPVVAHRYASAADMCAGAAVFVEDVGSLQRAIEQALDLGATGYRDMVEQAQARNRERSWKTAGTRMASLIADLLN